MVIFGDAYDVLAKKIREGKLDFQTLEEDINYYRGILQSRQLSEDEKRNIKLHLANLKEFKSKQSMNPTDVNIKFPPPTTTATSTTYNNSNINNDNNGTTYNNDNSTNNNNDNSTDNNNYNNSTRNNNNFKTTYEKEKTNEKEKTKKKSR